MNAFVCGVLELLTKKWTKELHELSDFSKFSANSFEMTDNHSMSDDNKNISIDAIAEQWVNLVLAHIEANKQKANLPERDNKKE